MSAAVVTGYYVTVADGSLVWTGRKLGATLSDVEMFRTRGAAYRAVLTARTRTGRGDLRIVSTSESVDDGGAR